MHPELSADYEALTQRAGWARVARAQIVLTGKDRATLLHKFCTQDVLGKQPGQGGEAFICNVQGKIVAYVYFFVGENDIVLDTAVGQTEAIIQHLDRYVITEDVQFHDLSSERVSLLIAGAQAESLLGQLDLNSQVVRPIDGVTATVRRVPFGGPHSYFLSVSADDAPAVEKWLASQGVRQCSAEAVEIVRIESATPLYGVDITLENLPQEVGRDAQAINFRKGCYLGQETVARIDALGHVNKHLVQVELAADAPPSPGEELKLGDKIVGRVTSSCRSPQLSALLALAYIRREHAAVGTQLEGAEVVKLVPVV